MIQRLFKKQTVQQNIELIDTPKATRSLFFVHIPKTAGTSFRKGLEAIQPMEKDYGANASETSPLIRENMHDEFNPYALKQAMLERTFALTGHVHVQKYADFFDIRHILTFLRDPIGQIVSHYNHFVTHNGFLGDFSKFYRSAQFRNVQYRYFNGFPLSLIGFTGITEHYNDSLTLINQGLGLELVSLKYNIGAQTHQKSDTLPQTVIDELVKLNQQDVRLYQQALELHNQRMAMFEQGKEWVHLYAFINSHDVLRGCAYFAANDEPVTLVVKANGEQKSELTAQEFCSFYPKFLFPRQRYVGFSLPLAKLRGAGISDIELVVSSTGQTYQVELPERFKR